MIETHKRDDQPIKLAIDYVNGNNTQHDPELLLFLLHSVLQDRSDLLNECIYIEQLLQDIDASSMVINKTILTLESILDDFHRMIEPPVLTETPAFLKKQSR